jgi:hypothetical protein
VGDKEETFKRLANARVNKALNDLRLVGNLSNRSNYDYTSDEVEAIISALKAGVADCKKRFDLALTAGERGFKLD